MTPEQCRAKAEAMAGREVARPFIAAINHTDSSVLVDDNWNPDAHVEIVVTVAECQSLANTDALMNPAQTGTKETP